MTCAKTRYDKTGFPDGSFSGNRALNVQGYTESNIKLGSQHESSLIGSIPSLGNIDTVFVTGVLPVIIKSLSVGFGGAGLSIFAYDSPIYSGGAVKAYFNPNTINPITGLSSLIVGSTVSDVGTEIFAPYHFLGSTGAVSAASLSGGQEKILSPNTTYLVRFTSLDIQSQQITAQLGWYEGNLDLPVGQ